MLPPWEWMESAIRIDSTTHRSNLELIRFLAPKLEAAGLTVETDAFEENGTKFANLRAFRNLGSEAPLALHTHLDTVPAGNPADWTNSNGDPFALTKKGDRITGLGAADVKLDFLCKLEAIRQSKSQRPLILVGTYGEERGLIGAKKLLERPDFRPSGVLVGEPSNLELIYAHKGHYVATVQLPLAPGKEGGERKSFQGLAAHSSTPHLGKNAIDLAIAYARKKKLAIASLDGGNASNTIPFQCDALFVPVSGRAAPPVLRFADFLDKLRASLNKIDRRFSPSRCTVSWNIAKTVGSAVHCTFDVRLLPDISGEAVRERVKKALVPLGGRMVSDELDPPLRGARDSDWVKTLTRAARQIGRKLPVKTKTTSTEAAEYALRGIPAVVFGPGVSTGNVHKPNEHNLLSQLEVATRFYSAVLNLTDG